LVDPADHSWALLGSAGGSVLIMPGQSYKGPLPPLTPDEILLRNRLRDHVFYLAGEIGERNTGHYAALGKAAQYIKARFQELGLAVREDSYLLHGKEMSNLVAEIIGASNPGEIVVVGAHYDSISGSPGANDNGSGVAAVLELARLLKDARPARTVRLIAFVNEEPPYFQSEMMGAWSTRGVPVSAGTRSWRCCRWRPSDITASAGTASTTHHR
jgi:Zn-dependent M28 family amino/carboxypeptidase